MRHSKQLAFAIVMLSCFWGGSCSPGKDKAVAIAAVDEFHRHYNNATYSEIYENAEPGVKEQQTKRDFLASMEAMRNGQGAVIQSKELAVDYNYSTEGNLIKLLCEVTYEKGIAKEEFIWSIANGKGVLHSYRFVGPAASH